MRPRSMKRTWCLCSRGGPFVTKECLLAEVGVGEGRSGIEVLEGRVLRAKVCYIGSFVGLGLVVMRQQLLMLSPEQCLKGLQMPLLSVP
jgi:hypothetical protein